MGYYFEVTTTDAAIDELKPLINKHWERVTSGSSECSIDWDAYGQRCAEGSCRVIALRCSDTYTLQGYAVVTIGHHPQIKDSLFTFVDAFTVDEQFAKVNRTAGRALLRFVEDFVTSAGAEYIQIASSAKLNIGKWLSRVGGFETTETLYTKKLHREKQNEQGI